MLKGIAILMMLFHHVFYSPDYGFWDLNIGGHGVINTFALMCKVCVAIFVFLSGYGLTEKYGGSSINIRVFYWDRFVKLFTNYWFIWLIFVPISALWLGPSLAEQYGTNDIVLKMALDFMGIINWFGAYNYNPTWWFYSCIIGLYLLYPALHYLAKKNSLYVVALGIAIYFLPSGLLMCVRLYVLAFICGMLYAKHDMSRHLTITPPLWSWVILLIVICVCRVKVSDAILYDSLLVTVLIVVYQYTKGFGRTKGILRFMGRHSMDMFLTHTFVIFLWPATHRVVFATQNPLLIYVTAVALSLMLALLLSEVKRLIRLDKFVEKLRFKE